MASPSTLASHAAAIVFVSSSCVLTTKHFDARFCHSADRRAGWSAASWLDAGHRTAPTCASRHIGPLTHFRNTSSRFLQIGGRVGLPEAGLMLDIAPHRPDLRATLQEAAAEAIDIGGGGDVGVYVAGEFRHDRSYACR